MNKLPNLFAPGEVFGTLKEPLKSTRIPEADTEHNEYGPVPTELIKKTPEPRRLLFVFRNGETYSYPYHLIGLIECSSPSEIIIHGGCSELQHIILTGDNLHGLVFDLNIHAVNAIEEGEENAEAWIVDEILVVRKQGTAPEPKE